MPSSTGMTGVAVFAAVLVLATLLSGRAARTAYSNNALFIGAGLLAGSLGLVAPTSAWSLREVADLALFTTLFSAGTQLSPRALRQGWRLPSRALLIALPLTAALSAAFAHVLLGIDWLSALLVGAVLSPTDPVFASALVERKSVPLQLRRLLNVESGLNDGLAFPLVVGLLIWAGASHRTAADLLLEIVLGPVVGIGLALACLALRRLACPAMPPPFGSLFIVAIGLAVLACARLSAANEYLAAFSAGIVLARQTATRDEFDGLAAQATELLKFAALLLFGSMISIGDLLEVGWTGAVFAGAVLLVARPVAILLALWRSDLPMPERAMAAWFGPKGFASVVYAMLVLHSQVDGSRQLFRLLATVVVISVLAHSSTAVASAQWFKHRRNGG